MDRSWRLQSAHNLICPYLSVMCLLGTPDIQLDTQLRACPVRQSVHSLPSLDDANAGHAVWDISFFSHRNHGPYPTASRVVSLLSVDALLLLRTSLEIAEAQVDPLAQRGEGQGQGGSGVTHTHPHTDAIHGHTAPAPAPAHSTRLPPCSPVWPYAAGWAGLV